MPGMNGIELVRTVRGRCPTIGLVVMTAYEPNREDFDALMHISAALLCKPVTAAKLLEVFDAHRETV